MDEGWDDGRKVYSQRDDGLVLRAAVVAPDVVGPCLGPPLREALEGLVHMRRTFDFCIEMQAAPSYWPAQPEWSAERFAWELIGHWKPPCGR